MLFNQLIIKFRIIYFLSKELIQFFLNINIIPKIIKLKKLNKKFIL